MKGGSAFQGAALPLPPREDQAESPSMNQEAVVSSATESDGGLVLHFQT